MSYSLSCAAPVKWLLDNEKDIRNAIGLYIEGRGDDVVPVVGPPSMLDMLAFRANPKQNKMKLPPPIMLRLRKIKNERTGERGIEVTCSADELAMIESWRRQEDARKAFGAMSPRQMSDRELG